MAGSYKMLKTLLLLFGIFHVGRPQDTFLSLSQNFCNVLSGGALPDNLSCPDQAIETGNCFLRSRLCDGTNDCGDGTTGSDEGDNNVFSSLECESNMFDCGLNVLIPLTQLCDGTDNCAAGARPGDDETAAICDNKCLADYYGSCDRDRICENSRNGVNCGDCFSGLVGIAGQAGCGRLAIASAVFTEGSTATPNPVQVCATLTYNDINPALSTTASVVFSPGTASAADYSQITQNLFFSSPVDTSAGSTVLSECVNFNIINDGTLENTESFTITVSIGSVSAVGTITILDDDVAIFGFSAAAYTGSEATQTVTGQVNIVNGVSLGSAATVNCNVFVSGTGVNFAQSGDFGAHSDFVVNFPAFTTSQTFSVVVVDDTFIENLEAFGLSLSNPSTGTVSTTSGTAVANIVDNDNPVFGFDPLTYTQLETDQNTQVFIIETSGRSFSGVTRPVTITSQTSGAGIMVAATSGVDFNAVNTVLNIGSSPFPFTYTLIDDTLAEPSEMFNLALTAGAGASIAANSGTATVTITDNEMTLFQFTMNPVNAAEGTPTVEVCVELVSGSPSAGVTLTLNPSPGTASASDFQDVTMFVSFPANSAPGTEVCANFGITDDAIIEGTESFTVTGSGGSFPTGQNAIQVNIADNDMAVFEFTQPLYVVSEGTTPAVAGIRLATNSASLGSPVSVSVSTLSTGGTATASPGFQSDFSSTSDTLTFATGSGPGTTLTFNVPIVDDSLVENSETIPLIASVVGGGGTFTAGGNTADIQINDNDVLDVAFQFQVYSMIEANDQMVCLTITGGTLAPGVSVSASVSTAPDTAIANSDYEPVPNPNMVTFTLGGSSFQCFTLDIINDNIDEPQERFFVTAAPSSGQIRIQDPSSDVLIIDDDLIIAQFDLPLNLDRYVVDEGAPNGVEICIDITTGIVGSTGLTINVADVAGGTAILGSDYNSINANLFFPPGTTPGSATDQSCFTFFPINDILVEFTENIVIMASSTNPDVQFTQSGDEAMIDIIDDDMVSVMIVPPVVGQPPFFNVPEDGGPLEVCVMLVTQSGVAILGRPVTVMLSTQDGTAIGAAPGELADYCTEVFTITIQPGEESLEFCNDILINNDMICEGNEDFSLVLESGSDGGTMITNSPGTATIIDDDVAEITTQSEISIPENIGMFQIHLILLGQKAPGRECVVTASTMDGTAVSGRPLNNDYVGGFFTATLSATERVVYIDIEVLDDGICEGLETFEIFLSTNSPGCAIEDGASPIRVEILDDEIGTGGDDPHFSIVLPSGKLLCYTVQGEHGFSFNLISNKKMTMNARFVPDSRRSEVTWMGSMGIIVHNNMYKQSNVTALRFEAIQKKIYIGDKVELAAKNIDRMTFKNGKLTISEAPPTDKFKYPSIYVDLQDVEISFTMKFLSEHLDIFWHRTGGKIPDSHGIIGQFFRTGVEIDTVRKILIMPNKEPVPVMRRPVWSFMEREKTDDQLCWTAMNPGYQGEGLIDGTYYDYLVDDVMTSEFEFKKQ